MADTTRIPIDFSSLAISHDAGNSFFNVNSLATPTPEFDLGVWEMIHTGDVDSYIYGTVNVPVTIGATPAAKIVLRVAANATTGNIRTQVSTRAVADGESLDGALSDEVEVTTTMPGTAFEIKEISVPLTVAGAPAANDTILVAFKREASDTGNDTLAANLLVVEAFLQIDLS